MNVFKEKGALRARLRKGLGVFLLIFSGILFVSDTPSWADDPVTVVQYPLINQPALILPGEILPIECQASSSVSGWKVTLSMPYKDLILSVTPGEYVSGVRKLTAVIPQDAPYELYDLRVQASGGIDDVVLNCVRILPEYEDTFTFVHLPDCHLPAVAWIGFYDDPNSVSEFEQLVKELNIIHPEFILQTGDLVDNGRQEDQYRLAQELLEEFEVPIFLTGGNHDLWYGHTNWHRYFGKKMDYSFRYGSMRFLGMEMYDTPSKTYTAEQMKWLREELNGSIVAGEESRVIFTHYDESRQLTGEFVDQYLIDGIFYGHTHLNGEQRLGLRQALKLNTSYTMDNRGEYRLVKISNGEIVSYPVLKFRRIRVNISPENDGTSWRMNAEVHNENDVDLESILVKLHVRRDGGPYTVAGGEELQFINYGENKRVYYITADVDARSVKSVSVVGSSTGNEPPMITAYSPRYDTTIYGGQNLRFEVQVEDADDPQLTVSWRRNGNIVSGEVDPVYQYRPSVDFMGKVRVEVEVSDGMIRDTHSWDVAVEKSPGKPTLMTDTRNFFPRDREVVLQWIEPNPGDGVFEYSLRSGFLSGTIPEEENLNRVRFVPEDVGMDFGVYDCRILSGGLSSNEFSLVIESSNAPQMVQPIGDITSLSPVFEWSPVSGVPFYLLILSDQEIIIIEDTETGEYSLEGANPIWAVLTHETSVGYGVSDPSGTFTNTPPPLVPGGEYWWAVLNCYGPEHELVSTVQSGVSHFRVNLSPSDLEAPDLLLPDPSALLSETKILFRWTAVPNAVGYHFYPYKVEIEEGTEVVRPLWETVISTTNTLLEYDAANLLVKGDYHWKVSSFAKDGKEAPSEVRQFQYDAASAILHLKTYDNRGTEDAGDDQVLPRVGVVYDAIVGVDMGLPLSTGKQGERMNFVFAPGTYAFEATKEGFAPYRVTLNLLEGQTMTAYFRLTPDPSWLTGNVLDQEGNPITAAKIFVQHNLHDEVVREAMTSLNGNFSVSLIPGPWIVTASKVGYQESAQVSVSIKSDEVKTLASPLVLRENRNRISGSVVNSSAQPLHGAVVGISRGADHQEKQTDTDGRFSFSVYDGNWMLEVSKNGFISPSSRWVYVSGGQSVEVSPSLELTPYGSMITGTVSDGIRVIGGASVKALPSSGSVVSTTSDSYGRYTLTLSPAYYSLHAEKEGFNSEEPVSISLGSGETVSGVELLLKPNSGVISGSVTIDGIIPLPDAQISLNGVTVSTDEGGRFEVEVPEGPYRITAWKSGYLSSAAVEVIVAPGQNVDGVNFVLTPNASVIMGRVTSGGRIAGATVRAVNGVSVETLTDDNGNYTLNVEPGLLTLTAEKTGFLPSSKQVEVGQAQILQGVNLSLTRNVAEIRGMVTDKSTGWGLMGARIGVGTGYVFTTTKQDGEYRLEVEPSDTGYEIRASKEGYGTKILSTGPLAPGGSVSVDFSLEIFLNSLSGTVVDENEKGVHFTTVTAVTGTDSYSTVSETDGRYFLGLPSIHATYRVSAEKKGYRFPAGELEVTLVAGENRSNFNLTLQTHFAELGGLVYNIGDSTFIANATLHLSNASGIVGSTHSDDQTGRYDFVNDSGDAFLSEGTYNLCVTKGGFEDHLIPDLSLMGGTVTDLNIGLRKHGGTIDGVVTDGSVPVADATVLADFESTEERYTQITDDGGFFMMSPIPIGEYRIKVRLSGYTFLNDTVVTAPHSGLSLIISKNVGRFWGHITDFETDQGIGSALIVVRDGHGNEARAYSIGDGSYDISQLPTLHSYDIHVSRGGYYSTMRSDVPATKDDTTSFQLERIYGSVTGRVTLQDGMPVSDIFIRVQSGTVSFSDTTDIEGRYYLDKLPTNLYYVFAEKVGLLSTPTYHSVNLYGGGDKEGIDFMMEEVTLADLTISGPSSVLSGRSGSYTYSAKIGDGRQTAIIPVWSVDPEEAVDSLTIDGILYPRVDFIGPVWIGLLDLYSGLKDSLRVQVVGSVQPGDDEWIFQDFRGGMFHLPAKCVVQPIFFGLKYPEIPDVKRLMAKHVVVGDVYAFQPAYHALAKPMVLKLPVPESASSECVLGRWNESHLKWEIIESIETNGGFETEADLLAEWAVLAPSQPLGFREFEAKPNPFSPYLRSLLISFVPTSRVSTHLFITIKVYNMVGDLVREIIIGQSVPKDKRLEVSWDGKTDSGSMALNGRYLLYMEAKDGSGVEKMLRPVVLIK